MGFIRRFIFNTKLILTGRLRGTDGSVTVFDWQDRVAIAGFHGERSSWLRHLGRRWDHNPIEIPPPTKTAPENVEGELRRLGYFDDDLQQQ